MRNTGKKLPTEDDKVIPKIDSPEASLSGPHTVVFKNLEERGAIVAVGWDSELIRAGFISPPDVKGAVDVHRDLKIGKEVPVGRAGGWLS